MHIVAKSDLYVPRALKFRIVIQTVKGQLRN